MDVLDHKCPSCTANIKFNPKTQKWDCEYCGSSYEVEDFEKYEQEMEIEAKSNSKVVIDGEEIDEYHCSNCGAVVVSDKNTTATSCVYCGNTTVIKERLQGEFKPEKIIPFANVKEDAEKEFYKFCKKKWFAPKDFHNMDNIREVKGIYIPFWLYNIDTDGGIVASAKRVKTWSSGSYRYTKTDFYNVRRNGNMGFEGIPADGSTKFEDDIMDSIEPYEYDKFKDFSMSYMSGFLAEKYDVSEKDSYVRAEARAKNSSIESLKETIKGYNSVTVVSDTIDAIKKSSEYVLLPVWLLNIKYKDKMYKFAMNGQTGKMVGNVPISWPKLLLKSLALWLPITIVLTIIIWLTGGI